MSDQDIELLKLQIQRDMQEQASRERTQQANRDFWKWAIMYVIVTVNPMNLLTSYLNHQAIADSAKDSAVSAAINTNYEYRRTELPVDKAKADRAEAKVMAQQQDAPAAKAEKPTPQ